MSKLMVAVCDADDGYRKRFVTYLVEHKAGEITVHAFSAPELFLEALKEQKFDLAIVGKGFETVEKVIEGEEIPLLFLRDTIPERVAESCGYSVEENKPCSSVFRYQSMETILHEMQVLAFGHRGEPSVMNTSMKRIEVIGVYSPIRHEMQMPFAMVLSAALSEKQKVLYVNLMEHSGFLELFRLSGEYDMEDIIFRLRNKRLNPETFLRSVYQTGQIHYIPPFANPENLHEFTAENYLAFLEFLENRTDFETVLLDFGEGIGNFAEILKHCSSVYCPVKTGFFFECQTNHFLEYLEKEADDQLRERLHMVHLPFSAKRIRRDGDVLRQLLWSEFGDYVRDYLAGAAYENH